MCVCFPRRRQTGNTGANSACTSCTPCPPRAETRLSVLLFPLPLCPSWRPFVTSGCDLWGLWLPVSSPPVQERAMGEDTTMVGARVLLSSTTLNPPRGRCDWWDGGVPAVVARHGERRSEYRGQHLLHDSCAYSTGRVSLSALHSQRERVHGITYYPSFYSKSLPQLSRSFHSNTTTHAQTNPSSLFPLRYSTIPLEVPAASAHSQQHTTTNYTNYCSTRLTRGLDSISGTRTSHPVQAFPLPVPPLCASTTHPPPSGQSPKHQRPIVPSPCHTNKAVRRAPRFGSSMFMPRARSPGVQAGVLVQIIGCGRPSCCRAKI